MWLTPQTAGLLKEFADKLGDLPSWSSEAMLDLAKMLCSEHGVKLVALAQPIRLAITGITQSPGIFELLACLEIDNVKCRIHNLDKTLEKK